MASIIRIKRSGVQGNPSILGQGELAYSYFNGVGGDRLYIGTGEEINGDAVNHTVIGGKHFVDLLGGEGDAPFGQLTPNTAVIVDADGKINEFKVDDLVFDGNSITTANLGDSRFYLAIKKPDGSFVTLQLTQDHDVYHDEGLSVIDELDISSDKKQEIKTKVHSSRRGRTQGRPGWENTKEATKSHDPHHARAH